MIKNAFQHQEDYSFEGKREELNMRGSEFGTI